MVISKTDEQSVLERHESGGEGMKTKSKREIPERWYEVFGMGKKLPANFDGVNVLRIPGHYFMKF